MQRKHLRHLVAVLVALVPSVYLLAKWETIPDIVPVHFNGSFSPDAWGPKRNLWTNIAILGSVSLLVYFLLENIHRFDPKRRGRPISATFQKLSMGLVIFISAIGVLIIMSCENEARSPNVLLLPVIGFLFVFLGNIMYNLKPNYIAGVRIPWTLKSDENWKLTHRFTGKLWFVVGLVIVFSGVVSKDVDFKNLILVSIAILVVLPIVYSYSIYKREKNY